MSVMMTTTKIQQLAWLMIAVILLSAHLQGDNVVAGYVQESVLFQRKNYIQGGLKKLATVW